MIVRPKTYKILSSSDCEIIVSVSPQQKWEAYNFEGEMRVSRKGTTVKVSDEDFEKYFKAVN